MAMARGDPARREELVLAQQPRRALDRRESADEDGVSRGDGKGGGEELKIRTGLSDLRRVRLWCRLLSQAGVARRVG